MNALNRIIMLLISLLLVVVPVLLLLVALGVVSPQLAEQYTGYSAAVDFLGGLSVANIGPQARIIAAIIGVLVALLLLLRELTFGRVVARNTVVDDSPGAETLITASAVRALSEGAAREAGATSPSISLSQGHPAYEIYCGIGAPAASNYTELAARVRENIRRALESQNVPVKDVEVTVRKVAS